MTFTANEMDCGCPNHIQFNKHPCLCRDKYQALLARLEAAEKCLESWEDNLKLNECDWCISEEDDDNESVHKLDCEVMCELEAWRKAAGK